MSKQKHIGLVVFALCSALSARIALFEPKPHVMTAAEQRWGPAERYEDPRGFLHGVRYYIYGIGLLGLLIVAEDQLTPIFRPKKRKEPIQLPETTRGK